MFDFSLLGFALVLLFCVGLLVVLFDVVLLLFRFAG